MTAHGIAQIPARPGAQGAGWSSDLMAFYRQLQDETMKLALAGVCAVGLVLFGNTAWPEVSTWGAQAGLGLLLLGLAVLLLRRWSFLVAALVLVGGCLTADLYVVVRGGVEPAICLLLLPAGLATLMIGTGAGAITGALCSLLLFAPFTPLPADPFLRAAAMLAVWSTVAMIWLTLRPLLTAADWAWSGYERSLALLEEARDHQQRLHQSLEDLRAANVQLTRLNKLVDGLRHAAEEARRAKEEFVARVSHELRTPLNMIIGFSEMITEAPQSYGRRLPPALLADLAVIRRNSESLAGLIDDVLDLSQIEAGQLALTTEPSALADIIEAAAVAVRPLFEAKGLYLRIEIPEHLPPACCDRMRIREVVLNLLSNAGRFTERGGVVVRAQQREGDIVVSVADSGPGIAANDMDKLFRPFQQLDGSMRRRHGGSGLGLAISRNLVELHGGRMWCESSVGVGTTIHFTLPIDRPPATAASALRWLNPDWQYVQRTRPSQAPVAVVRPRLVVLESGSSLGRLLGRYLHSTELICVATLERAVEELKAAPAQALVVNAAQVSEALQRFISSAVLPYGTPVIVCSVPAPYDAASALGACDYLVKPVSREALLAALERLGLEGKTVLVVDDEPDALQLFWRTLASAGRGYRVLTAADGRQALQLLREHKPDAILLDLVMPDMDGFQLLAAKNEDPDLREIPAVVISARDPAGQPIVSNALAATREGGLSVRQLLAGIEALSQILAQTNLTRDLAPTASPSG